MNKHISLLMLTALCSATAGFASDDTLGTTKMLPNDLAAARARTPLKSAPTEIQALIAGLELTPFSEEVAFEALNDYEFHRCATTHIVKKEGKPVLIFEGKITNIDVFGENIEKGGNPYLVIHRPEFPQGYYLGSIKGVLNCRRINGVSTTNVKGIINVHDPIA
jgi:hypothetical protein